MEDVKRMDPEMFSMVLDTISRLEKDRLTLETKLELEQLDFLSNTFLSNK